MSEALGLVPENAPQIQAATNSDAYNEYLQGQHLVKKRNRADVEAALEHFEKTVELDPDYAPGHAFVALATYLLTDAYDTYGTFTLDESLSVAEPAIDRALALDPSLADAHAIKGLLLSARDRTTEAQENFEAALRLNPSLTDVRNWYANMLVKAGQPGRSSEIVRDAYAIDPLSILTISNYLATLQSRRAFGEMLPVVERLETLDPPRAAIFRSNTLAMQRRAADSIIEILHAAEMHPDIGRLRATIAFRFASLGLRSEALRIWPGPDAESTFPGPEDTQRRLEIAQQNQSKSPRDPDAMRTLAVAYMTVDDADQAQLWAGRTLDSIDASLREIDWVNYVFAFDAWRRGDSAELEDILTPVDRMIAAHSDAGNDTSFMRTIKAINALMRGNVDAAAVELELALSHDLMDPVLLHDLYARHDFSEFPRLVEIRQQYEEYIKGERHKLLAQACGEVGFSVWKPLESSCAQVDPATPVPM